MQQVTRDDVIHGIVQGVLERAAGGPAALLLDYDGTLTPIVSRPEGAVLDDAMRAVLEAAARHPRLRVAIVTGRGREGLDEVAGTLPNVVRAVNGGLRIIDGSDDWIQPDADRARPELRRAAERLRKAAEATPGAQLEDKGLSLALHWRRCPEHRDALESAVREAVTGSSLRVIHGKAVFELQPDVAWDKGRACLTLLDRWGIGSAAVFLGDDTIDEAGFEAVQARGGLGVRVGVDSEPTAARWRVEDCASVERLLTAIVARAGR